MSHPVAAKQYPNSIFKQTTPDEEQALLDEPRFQTWYKGWLTRSEIYERKLPDGITSALRIDGPSDSALSLDGKGNIRILTGKKTEVAGSGVLGIKTWGQQQLHNERSNIQYCAGGTENEGQALNVLAYGDVVEECIGSTRYIKAAKIDGAGIVSIYTKIILPMMRPVFMSAIVILVHLAIKSYDLVIALTAGGPGISSDMPAVFMTQMAFHRSEIGLASASAIMMFLTVTAIVVPYLYSELKREDERR